MKIRVYQINLDRDENGVAFESYGSLSGYQESDKVNPELYDKVFDGSVEAEGLEDVYRLFNMDKPEDYCGRSLSISDVVEVTDSPDVKPGFYYCDNIGFKDIEFDAEKAHEQKSKTKKSKTITVVMCEPGKKAYVTEIGSDLKSLQAAVEGCIEAYYPFEEEVCIVCNDEGKLNGASPCRSIKDDEGKLMEIIFGKFFICDCSGEDFGSLSVEKQREYLERFNNPEYFFRVDGKIRSVDERIYDPVWDMYLDEFEDEDNER